MQRLIKIEFCTAYEFRADLCKTCDTAYILTDDKLKCLPRIQNCAVYELSSQNNLFAVCKSCLPKYYLEAAVCALGTISNC